MLLFAFLLKGQWFLLYVGSRFFIVACQMFLTYYTAARLKDRMGSSQNRLDKAISPTGDFLRVWAEKKGKTAINKRTSKASLLSLMMQKLNV